MKCTCEVPTFRAEVHILRYLFIEGALCLFMLFPGILSLCFVLVHLGSQVSPRGLTLSLQLTYLLGEILDNCR